MSKACQQCGEPFTAEHGNQKYCSKRCLNFRRELRRAVPCVQCGRPRIGGGRDVGASDLCRWCRGYGANVSGPRKPKFKPELRGCQRCGSAFEATRNNQKYCPSCRDKRPGFGRSKAPRLSSTQRGYGMAHIRERAKWKPIVEAGGATCSLCGDPIEPGSSWHLDHTPDRTAYRGPAHASCNRKDGARRGRARQSSRSRNRPW